MIPRKPGVLTFVTIFVMLSSKCSSDLKILEKPSTNYDERLIGPPDMLVLHQTTKTCEEILNISMKPRNFSVHYVICENGDIFQLVNESHRAWNSPNSFWHGRGSIDDWSISIEVQNSAADTNFTTKSLIELIKQIRKCRIIPDQYIVSSYDVALERTGLKMPNFPWEELGNQGIGIFKPNSSKQRNVSIPMSFTFLKTIGYKIFPQDGTAPNPAFSSALRAFQNRFLPTYQASGILDKKSYSMLKCVSTLYEKGFDNFWNCRQNPNCSVGSNLDINTNYPSKNFDHRLYGPPFMIVVHDTESNFQRSLRILTGKTQRQVSAHYLVNTDGKIYLLVNESMRAWQAGVSYWHGYKNINGLSIGIEIVNENSAKNTYPDVQIEAVIALIQDIRTRWWIPQPFIVSHEDIAVTRRSDPGPLFPWQKLAEAGIGLHLSLASKTYIQPNPNVNLSLAQMHRLLKRIGYEIEDQSGNEFDEVFRLSLTRFAWRQVANFGHTVLKNPVQKNVQEALITVSELYHQQYSKDYNHCKEFLNGTNHSKY